MGLAALRLHQTVHGQASQQLGTASVDITVAFG
jgi:hypothetical protein